MQYSKKVDFHSHFLSKTYYEYLDKYEGELPDGFPTPKWSAKSHLDLMDKLGIAFAFLSVSSPNLSGADKETECELVRKINIEGAEIVKEYPDKFGLFASLPLPHADRAEIEARFAHDELHADGFALSTHYAGVYLGDKRYDGLMSYLDSIGAVIAVHPVKPSALPKGVNMEIPIPAMEFFMDTTRTFTNMVMNDIFSRFPNIKWIFPHAGAFLSILSDRMSGFSMQFRDSLSTKAPFDFKGDMRHVYFDAAGFAAEKQLKNLLGDVTGENIVYGSDAPYTPDPACIAQTGALENIDYMDETDKENMFTLNAVRLVPRLGEILNIKTLGNTVCYSENELSAKDKANRNFRKIVSKVYNAVFTVKNKKDRKEIEKKVYALK